MDSETHIPSELIISVDIEALFEEVTLTASHPHEVFHEMLQRLTDTLPKTLSGGDVIREVSSMSRQITDCLIANEFEITY